MTTDQGPRAPAPGEEVGGRFVLDARLGDGGLSEVFIAKDRSPKPGGPSRVALKMLLSRYVGRPEREQRLINEAEYLGRLADSRRILGYVDHGRFEDLDGWPWLATVLMHGRTLGEALTLWRPSASEAIGIGRELARALRDVHAAGLVHRDVTPANVFLDESENERSRCVRLFDFGHAAEAGLSADASRLTQVAEVPGTLGFMSPEQAMGLPPAPCMDVFALGAVLCQVVTRRPPYDGFTDRSHFIDAQRVDLAPPRINAWANEIPESLAELIHDCMDRDPRARPSIDDVLERLDAIEGELVALPNRAASPVEADQHEPAPVAVSAPLADDANTEESPRRAVWLVALAVLVIAGAVAIGVSQRNSNGNGESRAEQPDSEDLVVAGEGVEDVATEPDLPAEPEPARDLPIEAGPDMPADPGQQDDESEGETEGDDTPAASDSTPKLTPSSAGCEAPREAAADAFKRWRWTELLAETRRRACFTRDERAFYRAKAHAELGQWEACVNEGKRGRDSKTEAVVRGCRGAIADSG